MKGEGKAMTNEMPRVEIPADKEKIKRIIVALEYQLQKDTNEKDRAIHRQAIKDLKAALECERQCL